VLVVDDDDDIRLLLCTILEQGGHVPTGIATGRGALELARTEPFDLILLDLHVPDLDAWSFLVHSWEDAKVKQIPVVMVTASDDEGLSQRAEAWGCRAFLHKPFKPEEVLETVSGAAR
jgi:CheY-like chemotaxis protein